MRPLYIGTEKRRGAPHNTEPVIIEGALPQPEKHNTTSAYIGRLRPVGGETRSPP